MPGPVHGHHFSVRVPTVEAREFDALAHAAGLRRSELLRLLICRAAEGDIPSGLMTAGPELHRARTVTE